MTDELIEDKIDTFENAISEIKEDIKYLPRNITKEINSIMDVKIKLALSETEKKYQAKFIALLLAIVGEGVGIILSFLKG